MAANNFNGYSAGCIFSFYVFLWYNKFTVLSCMAIKTGECSYTVLTADFFLSGAGRTFILAAEEK